MSAGAGGSAPLPAQGSPALAPLAPVPPAPPLLEVDGLTVAFPNRDGSWSEAVRDVSFTLGRERLGIVGESGSGKTQTGRAIMGLTAPEGRVTARRLAFSGIDLLRCPPRERRALRGGRIAMVLQDPKFSLNPVMTIGAQIAETLRAHRQVTGREARARTLAALESVQIDDPERVYRLYPARSLGRHGPAGHDRHDADRRAGPADRRRAHLGPGRDRAAAGAGHPGPAGGPARHGADLGLPRPAPGLQLSATASW